MSANDRQVGGEHYKGQKVEHWDFVYMHKIPYHEAQAIKYIMRHRAKGGVDDLRKAIHFIEKVIELEYVNTTPEVEPRVCTCPSTMWADMNCPVHVRHVLNTNPPR